MRTLQSTVTTVGRSCEMGASGKKKELGTDLFVTTAIVNTVTTTTTGTTTAATTTVIVAVVTDGGIGWEAGAGRRDSGLSRDAGAAPGWGRARLDRRVEGTHKLERELDREQQLLDGVWTGRNIAASDWRGAGAGLSETCGENTGRGAGREHKNCWTGSGRGEISDGVAGWGRPKRLDGDKYWSGHWTG